MNTKTPAIKRAAAAGIGVAALLGIAACGGGQGSPEDLGEAIAIAANDEDAEALKELTCTKDQQKAAKDFDFGGLRKHLKAPDLDFSVKFLKAEEKGDKATLTFKTTFENLPKSLRDRGMPASTENTQEAIEDDGDWYLCN